jgi:signal transduction histidine kinase
MIVSSVAVYLLSAHYRQVDLYERLKNKANVTARLLIKVDEIDINLLRKIEKGNPMSLPDEKVIIFNYKNNILFSTDENNAIKTDINLLNKIRLEGEVKYKQGKYEVLGFLYSYKYDRFVVLAAATDIYGKKRIHNLAIVLIIVVAVSLLLFMISGWIYAGKALKPITRIIKEVNEIKISSLNKRLHEGEGKDELEQLSHTFNNMLNEIEAAFKTQKGFIANASHELRTPLTAITGQLEFILMKPHTSEEYKNTLSSVFEDIKNLNMASKRLLLLAQTSSDISESAFLPVRMDEITWLACEDALRYSPDYNVKFNLDESLDDETMTVAGDEQLLKIAIYNLIENGCKYSNDHTVIVNIRAAQPNVIIEVIDHGIGMTQEDIRQITTPFFRGDNVSSTKGTGIGHSLIDRIIKVHHGTIQIISELNKGTQINLQLPLYYKK